MKQAFRLTPDEGIFGLGRRQDGLMNYRGHTVKLVQTNTDAVTPFLVSTNLYGVLWDNYSKTIFDDGPAGASLSSEVADGVDYYLIAGADMDAVIAGYRGLTGQAPMYGRWAYGYWQSKEHYHTQEEVLRVAEEYRRRRIPVDNIVQDWNYWGENSNWSGMTFDPTRYPRPAEMVSRLHDLGFHLMISIWPGLGPASAVSKDMDAQGFLYKPVGWGGFRYYDAYERRANAIYWKHLKEGLYSKGIDAWWIDSTEPDIINAITKESEEYEMKQVGRNALGSFHRYLNPYSLVMMDALYKNLRADAQPARHRTAIDLANADARRRPDGRADRVRATLVERRARVRRTVSDWPGAKAKCSRSSSGTSNVSAAESSVSASTRDDAETVEPTRRCSASTSELLHVLERLAAGVAAIQGPACGGGEVSRADGVRRAALRARHGAPGRPELQRSRLAACRCRRAAARCPAPASLRRPSSVIQSVVHGGSSTVRTVTSANPASSRRRRTSWAISGIAGQPLYVGVIAATTGGRRAASTDAGCRGRRS